MSTTRADDNHHVVCSDEATAAVFVLSCTAFIVGTILNIKLKTENTRDKYEATISSHLWCKNMANYHVCNCRIFQLTLSSSFQGQDTLPTQDNYSIYFDCLTS